MPREVRDERGRPPVLKDPVLQSIRLPRELYEEIVAARPRLQQERPRETMSIGALVRELCRRGLGALKKDPPGPA